MSWGAALLGLLFPGVMQALTGRWRRALLIVAALPLLVVLVIAWAPLVWLAPLVPLASAIDAGRAGAGGARASWRHLVPALGVLAALVLEPLLIERYVLEAFGSPASGMMPTIAEGDQFFVEKLSLRWSPPRRGELIVFRWPPQPALRYVKRVVALAGDELAVRDQRLYVNGEPVPRQERGVTAYLDGGFHSEVREAQEQLGDHRYRIYVDRDDNQSSSDFPEPDYGGADGAGEDRCARVQGPFPLRSNAGGAACVVPPGAVFTLGDNRWNSNDSRRWGAVPVELIVGRIRGLWWVRHEVSGARWSRLGAVE